MQPLNSRIILAGATGGIGAALARQLVSAGARVTLVGRHQAALDELCTKVRDAHAPSPITVTADLTQARDCARVVTATVVAWGGVDAVINSAGLVPFGNFHQMEPALLQRTLATNLTAPMLLTQAALPHMLEQRRGHIVNVGSIYGSIAFAYYAAYSASKFGLRGFSEALRRELAGTGVHVTYVAPRATRTAANSRDVYDMAGAVKMNIDAPEAVANRILEAMTKNRKDRYLGWPESLFVRINSLLPRLVDKALRKQNAVMAHYAGRSTETPNL